MASSFDSRPPSSRLAPIDVTPSSLRVLPYVLATLAGATPLVAQQTTPPIAGFGTIQGTVTDSIHRVPLSGAVLLINGVPRMGQTDAEGRYTIDSLPPGSYRIHLSHALLDTIGLAIATQPLVVRPGELVTLDLGVPSAEHIVSRLCPAATMARGPAAITGQVVDPETNRPAAGSKVQLLYEEVGPMGARTRPIIREATVDSTGAYRICGVPLAAQAKLQVFRNGVSSGQVDIRLDEGPLALRSLSVAAARVVATVVDSGGRSREVAIGSAKLAGKVVSKTGNPISAARVSVAGSGSATLTNARGEFRLDSLPAGTQSVEVRKIGYGLTDQTVELTPNEPTSVTVVMADYALPAVLVESDRDKALADIGYLDRKGRGNGTFLDGDRIRQEAPHFSDVMRQVSQLRLTPTSNGKNVIQSARDPNFGCVQYYVDGTPWKEIQPGDIDDFIQPREMRAVEVYGPATTPAQFQTPGQSGCTTVVVWTARGTNRGRKK
jgi:hypothetical protein